MAVHKVTGEPRETIWHSMSITEGNNHYMTYWQEYDAYRKLHCTGRPASLWIVKRGASNAEELV